MTLSTNDPRELAAVIELTSEMLKLLEQGDWQRAAGMEQRRAAAMPSPQALRMAARDGSAQVREQLATLLQLNDSLLDRAGQRRERLQAELQSLRQEQRIGAAYQPR